MIVAVNTIYAIAFVRTVAPVYCLLIETFDQLKNSRHDLIFIADICWLFQNAVIAELSRAKRASAAPWVRKFGKISIGENLVMT